MVLDIFHSLKMWSVFIWRGRVLEEEEEEEEEEAETDGCFFTSTTQVAMSLVGSNMRFSCLNGPIRKQVL